MNSKEFLESLARDVAGRTDDARSQCRQLVEWMHTEFEWSATDYQHRSLSEILARRAGNCAEQTRLLQGLLTAVHMDTRTVAEINIQAPQPERGASAARMVAERGPSASVFGYRHNDHRWLEVRGGSSESWFPADATLGVCGEAEWLAARMGFGVRPAAAKDMIVPVMAFVMDASGHVSEDRTEHYICGLFANYVEKTVRADALLDEWRAVVRELADGGKRAFAGAESFFPYDGQLEQALVVYRAIAAQYRQAE